jgi:hypothetical protein
VEEAKEGLTRTSLLENKMTTTTFLTMNTFNSKEEVVE